MEVHYGAESLHINNPVVTIGSFDGVHLGHLSVIRALNARAQAMGGESVIISFEPHPREVLYPLEKKLGILSTLEEKINLLEHYGVNHLIVLSFTRELARLSYIDFVHHILIDQIGIRGLVVGYDHRFGKDRAGDFDNLQELARQYHFFLEREAVFETNHVNVSSTKIRNALMMGNVTYVNQLLGYVYAFTGQVVAGCKLGRKIGFPTANLKIEDERKLLPINGVYAVRVKIGSEEYEGMLNLGVRPTVSQSGEVSLEVHLFNFSRQIYGEKMVVFLFERLRGERKFENLEELRLQLEKDKLAASACFDR